MTVRRFSNWIGIGLLFLTFAIAIGRVISTAWKSARGDETVIRMAHWRLEPTMKAAFDALAAEYNKLHPEVRISQIPVPDRLWPSWMRTQLVGGTPPDIMALGWVMNNETVARYIMPISDEVFLPNPYNVGTDLADTLWKDTFHDGLSNAPAYITDLMDTYSVAMTHGTFRLLYNRDLLEEITGRRDLGNLTLTEFTALGDQVRLFSKTNDRWLTTVSGANERTLALFTRMFGSQTQRLSAELTDSLEFAGPNLIDILDGYRQGAWDLDHPAIRGGLFTLQQFGREHNLGFIGQNQEDAAFLFLQEKVLFMPAAIFNAQYVRQIATFETGILEALPFISPDNPDWGGNTNGPNAEGISETGLYFGVTRESKHQEMAIDFLRFATSQTGNMIFSEIGDTLPVIEGVPVPPSIAAFLPNIKGAYPSGFNLDFRTSAPEIGRLYRSELHRLVYSTNGGVEDFIGAVRPRFDRAVEEDYRRAVKGMRDRIRRNDITLAAYWQIGTDAGREKAARLMHNQSAQQTFYIRTQYESDE